jgi:hypothetical protein
MAPPSSWDPGRSGAIAGSLGEVAGLGEIFSGGRRRRRRRRGRE